MMELVVPTIRRGGVNVVYVMVSRPLSPSLEQLSMTFI